MDQPIEQPTAPTRESVARVGDAARTAVDRTQDMAKQKLEAGAEQAMNSAGAAAAALRRAADDVSQDHAWIGSALRKSAEGIEVASQSLQGGDIERGIKDLSAFARRQPALFLGGSLAVGFALSRIGKTALEQATDAAPDTTVFSPSVGTPTGV
jgi:hypothetical protein